MSESKRNPTTEQAGCDRDALLAAGWLPCSDGDDFYHPDAQLTPIQARRFWRDVFAADRRNRARAAHVSPVRRAPRARRTRRVRTAAAAKTASGDPGGDGDPDAVSPELGRFLDWLADEACREAVRL